MSQSEEIKSRLDIVDVISSYLQLEKAGINFRARCPFHNEKTPSFFVSPARQSWKCFGCNEGGDIYTFVEKMEGVEFFGALEVLASKAGVVLEKRGFTPKDNKSKLFEICSAAAGYFSENLQKNEAVLKYLKERGLNKDTIEKFQIGFAPDQWRGLSDHLTGIGYKPEDIERAGLIIAKQNQVPTFSQSEKSGSRSAGIGTSYYDRFRSRIMFPLFDPTGRVVGFSGRIFAASSEALAQEEQHSIAKYVNTPQTELYNKSRILYGLNFAKTEIRRKDFCLMVEGQMDLIALHQAGFDNSVAVSGTALTDYHLRILKRFTSNLIIAFDADLAGENAAKKGIDMARSAGFSVKLLNLPEEKDPADFLQNRSGDEFENEVKEARSVMEFHFEKAFVDFSQNNVEDKKRVAGLLIPQIKIIPNKVEQSHWLRELADRLLISEEMLKNELDNFRVNNYSIDRSQEEKTPESEVKSREEHLGERLIVLFLRYPQYLKLIQEANFDYFHDEFQLLSFFRRVQENEEEEVDAQKWKKELMRALADRAEDLMFRSERLGSDFEIVEKEIEKEIRLCLRELEKHFLNLEAKEISFQIQQMERQGEDLTEFLKKHQKILTRKNELS